MEQTIKFTKKNTLAVKGIAISFLLCYHCFSQTARMGGAEVSFWRRDVCIFVRIWADTLYEVKISGI